MRVVTIIIVFLFSIPVINAQPPRVPSIPAEPVSPPKVPQTVLSYAEGYKQAIDQNKDMLVYVGVTSKPSQDAVVCEVKSLSGYPAKCVVRSRPHADGNLYWVETNVSGEKAVSQPASPFEAAQPTADDSSPWLSRAETEVIKKAWPKSVPFGKNLKFYSLERRYQQLFTMDGGRFKGRNIVPLEDHSATLEISGGMDRVHGSWKSLKGLDLPGKIIVWEEDTDVRAFAEVPRWRWQFPQKTVAYDVLFNQDGKIFEVRTQEKIGTGWKTKVFKDTAKPPAGYAGAGQSCSSCHDQANTVVSVPGRVYLHVVWGSDGRFSWRPFDDNNQIDARWPIERQ